MVSAVYPATLPPSPQLVPFQHPVCQPHQIDGVEIVCKLAIYYMEGFLLISVFTYTLLVNLQKTHPHNHLHSQRLRNLHEVTQ